VDNPHRAVDLYLVEAGTPGFEKGRKLKKVGGTARTRPSSILPTADSVANRLGQGIGFINLMLKLQQERIMCCIGAVAAAIYAGNHHPVLQGADGFRETASKFQNTQFEIVEMAADVKLGRTFLDKLIADHMEGKEIVVDVSMAKFWTTDMASRVADRCFNSTAVMVIVKSIHRPGLA